MFPLSALQPRFVTAQKGSKESRHQTHGFDAMSRLNPRGNSSRWKRVSSQRICFLGAFPSSRLVCLLGASRHPTRMRVKNQVTWVAPWKGLTPAVWTFDWAFQRPEIGITSFSAAFASASASNCARSFSAPAKCAAGSLAFVGLLEFMAAALVNLKATGGGLV